MCTFVSCMTVAHTLHMNCLLLVLLLGQVDRELKVKETDEQHCGVLLCYNQLSVRMTLHRLITSIVTQERFICCGPTVNRAVSRSC